MDTAHSVRSDPSADEQRLAVTAKFFHGLSDLTRLRIVEILLEGEKNVSELVQETGGLQANVSKHLGVLLDAGFVGRRKQGLSAYYRITDESIFELCDLVCGSIYDRLAAELESFSAPPEHT